MVRQAYRALPREIGSGIDNLAILVEDWPNSEELAIAGVRRRNHLFGLYNGIPLPDRGSGMPPLPDTITLFKRPIESMCATRTEVVREVKITLLHEVGHYMGLDEKELEDLGFG